MQETWPRNLWQGAAGHQQGDWAEGELLSFQKLNHFTFTFFLTFRRISFHFSTISQDKDWEDKRWGKKGFSLSSQSIDLCKSDKVDKSLTFMKFPILSNFTMYTAQCHHPCNNCVLTSTDGM